MTILNSYKKGVIQIDKNYILYEKTIDKGYYPMSEDMSTTLVICLLLIVLCILACGLLKSADILLIAVPPLIVIIAIVGIWSHINLLNKTSGTTTYKEVNLSSVHADIYVDGDKVTIDNLPDKYYYQDEVDKEGAKPTHISHRVFKYDGFYDTKKLIDENGVEFKLNNADTQFLKERGAK